MIVRPGTYNDAPDCHFLHVAALDRTLRPLYGNTAIDRWVANCESSPRRFERPLTEGISRVAVRDERVIGLSVFEPDKRVLSLWYVHPEFIGQGVGGRLLRELEAEVARSAPGQATLHATKHSEPRFRHHGWHHLWWVPCDACTSIPAVLMSKDIR
ncbi:MAG: GNAT family N-acetyltransferase [Fimbriimonadaceae bacterium]|nr:GNAT family N-acetyltransferase [Fimbriimonadaceae bacterium]